MSVTWPASSPSERYLYDRSSVSTTVKGGRSVSGAQSEADDGAVLYSSDLSDQSDPRSAPVSESRRSALDSDATPPEDEAEEEDPARLVGVDDASGNWSPPHAVTSTQVSAATA
jgi:hypothetical protein